MRRYHTNKSRDRMFFKHTANKVASANVPGYLVPRGGYRL